MVLEKQIFYGIYNPENSFPLTIVQNKDMVKIKSVVIILKTLADDLRL